MDSSPIRDDPRIEVARFLTRMLLGDAETVLPHIERIDATVDELVVVTSPSMHVRSRNELVTAIVDRDDSITGTSVEITDAATGGRRVYIEWRVTGRFDNAGFINDDILVEPSHSEIEMAGMLAFSFERDRASHISCYYDGIALLEQVLTAPADDD